MCGRPRSRPCLCPSGLGGPCGFFQPPLLFYRSAEGPELCVHHGAGLESPLDMEGFAQGGPGQSGGGARVQHPWAHPWGSPRLPPHPEKAGWGHTRAPAASLPDPDSTKDTRLSEGARRVSQLPATTAQAAQAPAPGRDLARGAPAPDAPDSRSLQAFYYPEEAGLAFGGPGSSRFLRLEVHYHNPLRIHGRRPAGRVQALRRPPLGHRLPAGPCQEDPGRLLCPAPRPRVQPRVAGPCGTRPLMPLARRPSPRTAAGSPARALSGWLSAPHPAARRGRASPREGGSWSPRVRVRPE